MPCPSCGLTRSWQAAGHGRLRDAVRFHPLGPLTMLAAAWLALDAGAERRLATQPRAPGRSRGRRLVCGLAVAAQPPAVIDVAAHVGPQHLRHGDRAVGPLVRLEERRDDARQRQPRAVQRVDELRLGARLRSVADRHPARLVVAEVRARADLEPALDARRPHLEVVLPGLDEAHLAGAHQQRPGRPARAAGGGSRRARSSTRARPASPSGLSNSTISTLSNWWTRRMPRVSLPAAPASRRKQGV